MALALVSNDTPHPKDATEHPIRDRHSFLNFNAYAKFVYHYSDSQFEHEPIDGYKSIWRKEDDGREIFLGIVSKRYKIIQNWQLFMAIEKALIAIFGSLNDVQVIDEWTDDGATCMRQYIVHSSVRQLDANDRSRIAFRVIARNSFDGTCSVSVLSGAIDFFCTNGTIIGEFDRLLNSHHTDLNVEKLTTFIKNAYEAFGRDFEMNVKLLGTSCTRVHAVELLKKLNDTDKFNDNIGKELDNNISQHGWNLWAVLSTATWWSSTRDDGWASPRGDAATNNAPIRRLERQKEVRAWSKTHLVPHAGTDKFATNPIVEAMP